MKIPIKILLLYLATTALACAAEPAVMVRQAPAYAEPTSESEIVGRISAGSRLTQLQRKGGWKQVAVDGSQIVGWVRSFQVRKNLATVEPEESAEAESSGFLSGLAKLSRQASSWFSSGGAATSGGTATIGIRGLSEDEIRLASPDFEALETLSNYMSYSARLRKFTEEGKLKARKVAHFDR